MKTEEIALEEYKALRTEIAQSISKQHWLAVGGYLLAGTISTAIIGKDTPNLEGLFLIPAVFLSAASLWLVETNRMVRASYFIAYVSWLKLFDSSEDKYNGWEHWIRDEAEPNNEFCKLQHR